MQLQRNSKIKTYVTIWELLVYIDIIKKPIKKAKTKHMQNQNSGFLITIINTIFILA